VRTSFGLIAVVSVLTMAAVGEPPARATTLAPNDSTNVAHVLASARNAAPLLCEFAVRTLDARFGSWGSVATIPDAVADEADIVGWAMHDLNDPATIPMLAQALGNTDRCVRRVAARLLGRMTHPDAEHRLLDMLTASDAGTREMAAIALGFSERHSVVASLIDALADTESRVRAAATWALGTIEDPLAIPGLISRLQSDPDASVRVQAAWAIGRMY